MGPAHNVDEFHFQELGLRAARSGRGLLESPERRLVSAVHQTVYRANLGTGHVEVLFTLPAPVGRREVEGIALRSARQVCQAQPLRDCAALGDDAVDVYVEMTVDPDNSGNDLVNPNIHVSLYHYEAQP